MSDIVERLETLANFTGYPEDMVGVQSTAGAALAEIRRLWRERDQAVAQVEQLTTGVRELLPWLEDAETKCLVGDEGCIWAVEKIRHLIGSPAVPSTELQTGESK